MEGPSYYKSSITTKMAMEMYDSAFRRSFIEGLIRICIWAADVVVIGAAIKVLSFL